MGQASVQLSVPTRAVARLGTYIEHRDLRWVRASVQLSVPMRAVARLGTYIEHRDLRTTAVSITGRSLMAMAKASRDPRGSRPTRVAEHAVRPRRAVPTTMLTLSVC